MSIIFLLLALLTTTPAHADWAGHDWIKGVDVSIDDDDLLRVGNEVEVYDGADGKYKDMNIENIKEDPEKTTLKVYDKERGEYRVFEIPKK